MSTTTNQDMQSTMVGEAIRAAGVEHLNPAAKRYLGQRMLGGWVIDETGGIYNLGAIVDLSFGCAYLGASPAEVRAQEKTKAARYKKQKQDAARKAAARKKAAELRKKKQAGKGKLTPAQYAAQKAAQARKQQQQQDQQGGGGGGGDQGGGGGGGDQDGGGGDDGDQGFSPQDAGQFTGPDGQPINITIQSPGPQPGDQQPWFAQQQQPDGGGGDDDDASMAGALGLAEFSSLDVAARTLVGVAFRAGPRDWSNLGDAEHQALDGSYPNLGEWPDPSEQVPLGWWPGFGPSPEADAIFRSLAADWVAFERLAGQAPSASFKTSHDGWIVFRDAWLNGALKSSDIGPMLHAQIVAANAVRAALKASGAKDPALDHPDFADPGFARTVDRVINPARGLVTRAEAYEMGHPWLDFLTKPRTIPGFNVTLPREVMTGGLIAATIAAIFYGSNASLHATDRAHRSIARHHRRNT
jgi:hypothetical protein